MFSERYMEGALRVGGRCLEDDWKVCGKCLEDVWMVTEWCMMGVWSRDQQKSQWSLGIDIFCFQSRSHH